MEKKEKDTMKEFLQKQPHKLTIAKHNLGIHQMRIMARIVHELQPYMSFNVDYRDRPSDKIIKIKVSELVKSGNYKPLKDALDGLIKKVVHIMYYLADEAVFREIGVPIIQKYDYKHGSEFVDIQISGDLLHQIIDLAQGYTKYSLNVAFNTSSPNVFKLYQYISHFRDKKQIQLRVETLREWLKIEDKYSKPAHIKQRILDPAMRELKEKADVWFDIAERVTEGRKMIGWKFNIYTKKEAGKASIETKKEENTEQKKMLEGKIFQRLCEKFDLSTLQAMKIIKKVDEKDIYKTLYEIQNLILAGKVSNKGGYTAKVFSEKFNIKL